MRMDHHIGSGFLFGNEMQLRRHQSAAESVQHVPIGEQVDLVPEAAEDA